MYVSEARAYAESQLGQPLDFDGAYGKQCVDWFNYYFQHITGVNPYTVGYGVDYAYELFDVRNNLVTVVANNPGDPNQLPPEGAIIIYDKTSIGSGGAGHVDVAFDITAAGYTCYGENDLGPYLSKKSRGWNSHVRGWIILNALQPDPAPTPIPSMQGWQRVTGAQGANYRTGATTAAPTMPAFPDGFNAGDVADFKGWVHGESVSGNDVWFIGRYSNGFAWSGAFTDSGTHDLDDMNAPVPVPVPVPTPVPDPTPTPAPEPVVFTPDSPCVTRVVESKNFIDTAIDSQYIVIHQWDDPAKKPTLQGVLNTFQLPDGISPHYVINDDETIQLVHENKRAQHAGPTGNDHIGIEFDPNGGEKMYQRGRALIADIRARHGKAMQLKGHNEFMATSCPKFIDIPRLEPVTVEPSDLEKRMTSLEQFNAEMVQFFIDHK